MCPSSSAVSPHLLPIGSWTGSGTTYNEANFTIKIRVKFLLHFKATVKCGTKKHYLRTCSVSQPFFFVIIPPQEPTTLPFPPPHECLMLQAHGLSLCIMALRGHESFIVLSTFSLPLPGANFPPFETLRVFSIQDAAFNGCMTPTAWP